MVKTEKLKEASRWFRSSVAHGDPRVDETGGAFGAGLIQQASVIMRGPALGHGMWIDKTMLQQVKASINTVAEGVKGRFTHPGMSGDGMGKALGRWTDARVEGDKVLADLHFFESAHQTPNGDLAGYVLKLAQEDPAAFGVSIAFTPDRGAEDLFVAENKDKKGIFTSPDKGNTENLPHVRLAELHAGDVVDEPAANKDGLFHRNIGLLLNADDLFEYCFRNGPAPDTLAFGIAPERVRGFAQRWMERRGLRMIDYRAQQERERELELDRQ